jgi:hypothetical protein
MVLSAILIIKTHKRIKKIEKRLKNIERIVKRLENHILDKTEET